jgi:hypothetical protein
MSITRPEKGSNERMRCVGTGRKFRMALHAHIKRVIRELGCLSDAPAAVMRRDVQSGEFQNWHDIRVQAEAIVAANNRLYT